MTYNYFGHRSFNPDNNPEGETFGDGSERPIGFLEKDINYLFWNIRSFNCNFVITIQSDPLSAFLSSSSPTSIVGALASLSLLSTDRTEPVVGYTKISTSFKQKQRVGRRKDDTKDGIIYTWDGVKNGKTITKISLGNNQKTFTYSNNKIYEGQVASGPIHSLGGKVVIDFSNIKYYNRKYWPRIIITTNNATSKIQGSRILGGVSFMGQLIPMFSAGNILATKIAFGAIEPGNRLNRETNTYDKFLWDGTDYYEQR